MQAPFSALLSSLLCAAACALQGCISPGEEIDPADAPSADAAPDADVADAAGDDSLEDAFGDVVVADATADVLGGGDSLASDDGAITGDADAEVVDAVSISCGDGIRDPLKEECDEAVKEDAAGVRTTCTSTCKVVDLLALKAADAGVDATVTVSGRTLGAGRHPVALSDNGFALAFVEPGAKPPRVVLTTFDAKGRASDVATVLAAAGSTPLAANPVVATLPAGKVAVAWNDLGGDGDGLGVALRVIAPPSAPTGAPSFANVASVAGQFDPDVLWTGAELIVAWVDSANVARGLDLKYRRFSASLAPLGGEEDLATTLDAESDVALSSFGASWMAAWRSARGGQEAVHVRAGTVSWSIGPFRPGPVGSRPGLAQLDSTHSLVVFVASPGEADASVSSEVRWAVLDTAAPGAVSSSVMSTATSALEVNLVRAGTRFFLSWRSAAPVGDVAGEELWLKELVWTSAGLDLSKPAIPAPRDLEHRGGDQRRIAMSANAAKLVLAWDDFGKSFAAAGSPDVIVESIPLPLLRIASSDSGI